VRVGGSRAAMFFLALLISAAPRAGSGRSSRRGARAGPREQAGQTNPVVMPKLLYCGGPVLSQAQIVAVLWGPAESPVPASASCTGAFKDCLTRWYTAFVQSPQFAWLDEYQTTVSAEDGSAGTGQHILPPTFYGVVQISPHNQGAVVGEIDVENELVQQIQAGNLPAPGAAAETIYEVHFPLGVDPSDPNSQACSDFCAYHDSWVSNTLCGEKSDWFANLGGSMSHESIEAITDPLVGSAGAGCAAPLAWYDANPADALNHHGEVGDMCEGIPEATQAEITEVTLTDSSGAPYTVQREWSNRYASCLTAIDEAFTIAVPSATLLIAVGGQATATLTSTLPENGDANLPIALSAYGVPGKASVTFSPATLNAGESSTITVALEAGAAQTGFSFGVAAESGTSQAQAVVSVSAPDFAAMLSPGSLALTAGGAPATLLLDSAVVTGAPRGLTVQVTGIPGVSVTPASGELGTPLSLSLRAAAGTGSASAPLIVLVASGGVTHSLPVQLTVTGDDASIAAPPVTLAVAQGGSITFPITSSTTAGQPQPLALSARDLPRGVTATFSPATITSGQTAQVTLSVPAAALPIPFAFTISAHGPVNTFNAQAQLNVVPASGCASPGASLLAFLGLLALGLRARSRRSSAR